MVDVMLGDWVLRSVTGVLEGRGLREGGEGEFGTHGLGEIRERLGRGRRR